MRPLHEVIERFFKDSTNPILFAGAGVAAHAGLPTWGSYLAMVAELVRSEDPYIANGMHNFLRKEEFARAVSLLFLSTDIRDGDKLAHLATPLKNYDRTALVGLSKLPFSACITTNFDKSFHDAYALATSRSAIEFNLDDDSLNAAAYEEGFFVARIHGRVEVPKTMVLSDEQYKELLERSAYLSLLEHVFTRRQVLFIGFSFLDPAIRHVFRAIERKIGAIHDGRHVALLPSNIKEEFVKSLERHNIKRVLYDPADDHRELWEGITAVRLSKGEIENVQIPISVEPLALAKKYLAACYARTHLRSEFAPLSKSVFEGMVSHLTQVAGTKGLSSGELETRLAKELRLSGKDVRPLVDEALRSLMREGICRQSDSSGTVDQFIYCGGYKEDDLERALQQLVKSAVSRFVVREGGVDTGDVRSTLRRFFEAVVVQRGWDLGAAFAARRAVEDVRIDKLIWTYGHALSPKAVEGLISACNNLFSHPDSDSAAAMATLGRASFALELVLQSPRDALFHSLTLPQIIYLDANVLLPAITEGHPYHKLYKSSIDRLTTVAAGSFGRVQVITYEGFLNEVVSHRRLASEQLNILGLDEAEAIAKYYGPTIGNVFLGAFFNQRLSNPNLTFESFLKACAPYNSEHELANWLRGQRVSVASESGKTGAETIYGDIYHQLEVIFADQVAKGYRTQVTVRHDAVQLVILDEDRKRGIRSILVSADRKLRDGLRPGRFAYLGNAIVDGLGLTQLIDLLIGSPADSQGLSSMLWTSHVSSNAEAIRNYLIDRALEQYDEAIAMQLGDLVNDLAAEAAEEAERRGINLVAADAIDQVETFKFLGSFEDQFYEAMQKIIERRRAEADKS